MEEVELVPGGSKRSVTDDNKREYVEALVRWHVGGGKVPEQVRWLLSGFHELVSADMLGVFKVAEVELLLCGRQEVDVDEMRACTQYRGDFNEHHDVVCFFWEAMESLSHDERGAVLRFVTGTSRVPLDGFDPVFTLSPATAGSEALPTTHTCFNQLVLPGYSSTEELRTKLLFAIKETQGFHMS